MHGAPQSVTIGGTGKLCTVGYVCTKQKSTQLRCYHAVVWMYLIDGLSSGTRRSQNYVQLHYN